MLVILSGVSGAGKDTIKKELIKRRKNIVTLPSFTDRPKRNGDVEGKTYNFVTTEEFEKMIENTLYFMIILLSACMIHTDHNKDHDQKDDG